MKLLSIVVCCYNSQEYMATAIESLLKGGEDVEIIIVDDGSKDDTGKIADEYVAKYPTICKVVHQPNGGHGAGVQSGIREATGQFFKIVDSDDWVDDEAYQRMLAEIREKGDKVDRSDHHLETGQAFQLLSELVDSLLYVQNPDLKGF